MMKRAMWFLIGTGVFCVSPAFTYEYNPSDFATAVEEYFPGESPQFSDPASALGRPTVDTRGDGGATGSPLDPVVVLPVNPPFRGEEVVSIGDGGHLTLMFDHQVEDDPRNPCGIDFIIFGNALHKLGGQFWTNGDPNQFTMQSATLTSEPGVVAVSQDGQQWFTFDNSDRIPPKATPYADTAMPTLGRIYDPENPESSLGEANAWWSGPTNPTLPVNPLWTPATFVGLTVAQYARCYGDAAGGTGFDLEDVGLTWMRYVRITNDDGDELTPDIDAVSDVKPYLFPDFDCDNDVDSEDREHFMACVTGPSVGPTVGDCARADFDQDGDVDQTDFACFQRCYSGANHPPDRDCMAP